MDFTWLFITGGGVAFVTLLIMLLGLFSSRASLRQANIWRKRLDQEIRLKVEAVHSSEQLKANMAQKQREFEAVQAEMKRLQKRTEEAESTMREAQHKANTLTASERLLKTQLSNVTAQSTETARKTSLQHKTIESLGEQLEQQNATLAQTQKELLNQQQLISQLQQRQKDWGIERELSKKQIGLHVESIQKLQTDLSNTKKQLGTAQRENARLESWLAASFNIDVHTKNSSDVIATAQGTLATYQQKLAYQEKQIQGLTDALNERNIELEQAQKESTERLEAINALATKLQNAELELQEADAVKESFGKMTTRSHHDVIHANVQLQNQHQTSQQILAEIEVVNKQLEAKDLLISERDEGIVELRSQLQQSRDRLDALRADLAALNAAKASGQPDTAQFAQESNDIGMSSIDRITQDLLLAQDEINRTQFLMDKSQQDRIDTLKNGVKQFAGRMEAARAGMAESAEVKRLMREIEEMRNQKRRTEESYDRLKQSYMQARNVNSDLNEQLRQVQARLLEQEDQLKASQTRTVQVRSEYEKAREIITQKQVQQARPINTWESLAQISGLSPEYAEQLRKNGILSVKDLAEADPDRLKPMVDRVGGVAKLFKGGPDVDDWVRHAKLLVDEDNQRMNELPSILRNQANRPAPTPPPTDAQSDILPGI
ncbi:MAG: DUF4332 domain-containing protein [Anaerolineae bacterium]|nr:DUF4332 domain-containing protein [Anaerolineae bacterium]